MVKLSCTSFPAAFRSPSHNSLSTEESQLPNRSRYRNQDHGNFVWISREITKHDQELFLTIVCEPRHDIDKGHLVNNLEKLNRGSCDDKRNSLTNRINQESPSVNPFTSLLLSKNRREQACLCKVIKSTRRLAPIPIKAAKVDCVTACT